MRPFVITIDYDNNTVQMTGDVTPKAIRYLKGVIEYIEEQGDKFEMSRELGNIGIQLNEESRRALPPQEP